MNAISVTTRADQVVLLTIDQPGSRANILTPELWHELGKHLHHLAQQPDVRGLILASGKPGMFIAGADLKFLGSVAQPNDPTVRDLMQLGLRVLFELEALPFPTIAAIDGPALGGGFEVALACDYRISPNNPGIRLGLPEVQLGLIPGWGGTQRLPRLLSGATALRLIASGQTLTPTELAELGGNAALQLTKSNNLIEAAADVLQTVNWSGWRSQRTVVRSGSEQLPMLTELTTTASRAAWRCVDKAGTLDLAEGCRFETEEFVQLAGSSECRDRIAAFFASRKK